jgi:hypothetical protein
MRFRSKRVSEVQVREQILASKPIRRADAVVTDHRITVPIPARRWLLSRMPEGMTKTFELDEIGLFVWSRCDGQTTVQQIADELASQFDIDRERAQASTLAFLNLLASRALVARRTDSG